MATHRRASANAERDAARKGLSGSRRRRYIGGAVNRAKQERRNRLAGRTRPPRRKLADMSLAERWRRFGKRQDAQRLERDAKAQRREERKAGSWEGRRVAGERAGKLEAWRKKLVHRYVHLGRG